jgi:hypothetical protein
MAVNGGLLTRWIDREGAKRIMVEAGIMAHEIAIAEFSVADRDRQDYVCGLLFEVAYAVASRSANPAALVAGEEEEAFYSHAERLVKKWAETSAAELELLLESL